MGTRAVELRGAGGVPVTAGVEVPPGRPAASAGLVSCFAGLGQSPGRARLCHARVPRGFAVRRLDFTAPPVGSDGAQTKPDTLPSVDAVVEAAAWLRERYPPARLLVGHSLGGTAAAAA